MTLTVGGKLLLVGAGKMGTALLEGWLKLGLPPGDIAAVDPHATPENEALLAQAGVALNPDLAAWRAPSVLVLAIKPQTMAAALSAIAPMVSPRTLVLSIMAGKRIADIAASLPDGIAIVRSMPNTPAAVGRGITVAVPNGAVTEAQRGAADQLLKAIGKVEWVDGEALIDAVTAVSGSGPAYVFHLVEAMAEAGRAAGLPEDLAMRLARATVEGAGELLYRSDLSPETLRQNVTSPGGTTAAALAVLMGEGGMRPLMERAVAAAKRRAGELAG